MFQREGPLDFPELAVREKSQTNDERKRDEKQHEQPEQGGGSEQTGRSLGVALAHTFGWKKAALKRPHSKRCASEKAGDVAHQRLECGRLSAAFERV